MFAVGLALMHSSPYAPCISWEVEHRSCPNKTSKRYINCLRRLLCLASALKLQLFHFSGHDCGVYVMAFMDILSMNTHTLPFERGYVHNVREKFLLSILQGKISHFPEALEGR